MTIKKLKSRLRKLKKVKKDLRVGSKERKEINKQMKAVKQEIAGLTNPGEEKSKTIAELESLYSRLGKPIVVDFRNYTEEQLRIHLDNVKNGKSYCR